MTDKLTPEDLNPWFYPVTIGGRDIRPGVYPEGEVKDRPSWELVIRQNLRRMILVEELVKRVDITDRNILDVGCNCGFWSLCYVRHGAIGVHGLEGRLLFVKQARMLFEDAGYGPEYATFEKVDVVEHDYVNYVGCFDFILAAGIFYHLADPEALLRKLTTIEAEYMLIDTRVLPKTATHTERGGMHFNSIDSAVKKVKVLSLSALQEALAAYGYDSELLPVPFGTVKGIGAADDYNRRNRVALLCKRR